jgi:hypothetical protein
VPGGGQAPRPGGESARALAALAREAQVAGTTAHPGIRRLLSARLERPLPHLVFEYVEGPTLDDALADDRPFHPIDVLLVACSWPPPSATCTATAWPTWTSSRATWSCATAGGC